MKKRVKFVKVVLVVLMISCMFNTRVFANSETSQDEYVRVAGINDIINSGNQFISEGKRQEGKYTENYFATQFVDIGQILVAIGGVTVLIAFAVMGIKWLTAKPDKKAQLQQQLIGLVIATIVIFGAVGIWNVIRSIGSKVETQLADCRETSVVRIADK